MYCPAIFTTPGEEGANHPRLSAGCLQKMLILNQTYAPLVSPHGCQRQAWYPYCPPTISPDKWAFMTVCATQPGGKLTWGRNGFSYHRSQGILTRSGGPQKEKLWESQMKAGWLWALGGCQHPPGTLSWAPSSVAALMTLASTPPALLQGGPGGFRCTHNSLGLRKSAQSVSFTFFH